MRLEICEMVKQAPSRLSCAPKGRQVTPAVFRKWKSLYGSYHQSLSWLQFDTDQENHGMVDRLPVVRSMHEGQPECSDDKELFTKLGLSIQAIRKRVSLEGECTNL